MATPAVPAPLGHPGGPTRRRGRALATLAASGLVVAGLLVGGPAVAPAQDACPEPYAPLASVDQYSGSTATLPEVPGDDVVLDTAEVVAGAVGPLDSDGDGQPDEIGPRETVSDPATVTRGDGTLTFVRAGAVVSISGNAGDLDGDGRDEILVSVGASAGVGEVQSFVVPGTTGPGTHDPADVGIEAGDRVAPIPDRDGDGVVELLDVAVGFEGGFLVNGPTRVLSGAAVIAVGAPGDATDLPALVQAPGALLAFADLGGPLPVLITGEVVGPPGEETEGILHLADEGGDEAFTTDPYPFVVSYTSTFARPRLVVGDQGTFLALAQGERSAARAYLWRVDDPCGALPTGTAPTTEVPPASTPVTSPAAAPITADATFTG
ncbi:VCBS repeat-containing protein [Iamia majanohamensis]|uniref:VCBS repeat-containing protein n=1 Tax=Iamia majanohamensis TaxID=467976 RepID=A0AAF0BVK8_9ACTN|nr:VCBS repeat-containing protein [Iamia majanohamensis]WCO68962.1 VCBS repeat-containing protein [Iamia majanohamensis]